MTSRNAFAGCLLGLALGDAMGAPYEGGVLERLLWRVIGRRLNGETRWTDDTQMSLDLAESLIAKRGFEADDVAARFAAGYRWSRGYGPGAGRILKRIRRGVHWSDANRSVFPDGSFGNGAAMRVPVVALFHAGDRNRLLDVARESARITHCHPLAVEGAVLVAVATAEALETSEPSRILAAVAEHAIEPAYRAKLAIARQWIESTELPEPRTVSSQLGNGIAALDSTVTAIYLALRFLAEPFTKLQRFVVAGRGDVDTIGAMSGAIWGAANGSSNLPHQPLARLEQRERIERVADSLFDLRST